MRRIMIVGSIFRQQTMNTTVFSTFRLVSHYTILKVLPTPSLSFRLKKLFKFLKNQPCNKNLTETHIKLTLHQMDLHGLVVLHFLEIKFSRVIGKTGHIVKKVSQDLQIRLQIQSKLSVSFSATFH